MRAEKIGITLEKNAYGKYNLRVVGINGDRIVSSVSDLEESNITLSTADRVVDRLWKTIRLRLNRDQLQLEAEDKDNDDDNKMDGR